MAKIIQQETFDAVLKENIIEFSMNLEDARKETTEQFLAQGINLANIIKDLEINEETGNPILNETIQAIKDHVDKIKRLDTTELNKTLDNLISELNKSVPHRVLASKNCTQDYLIKIMEDELQKDEQQEHAKDSVLHKSILCAHALINKNPDIFNGKSLETIIKILDTEKNEYIVCDILKWIQKACLLHELNRQLIMNEEILVSHMKPLLKREEMEIVKNICTSFRYLILDDDIRVEFGKAHEHARLIGSECLSELTQLLVRFKGNPDMTAELMLTIASLSVRNEFCQLIADGNGITLIMDAMVTFPDSIKVLREALKLLKALAGNDSVKADIIKSGAAPLIESTLNRHKVDEILAKNALACVTALSLRSKDNSMAFFEAGIAETILETMKIHEKNKTIQRNAAWAIRNMVSRSREQCESWISLGVEDILETARKNHPSIDQDCRYASRDLGIKVQLKEEWKGTADKIISNE